MHQERTYQDNFSMPPFKTGHYSSYPAADRRRYALDSGLFNPQFLSNRRWNSHIWVYIVNITKYQLQKIPDHTITMHGTLCLCDDTYWVLGAKEPCLLLYHLCSAVACRGEFDNEVLRNAMFFFGAPDAIMFLGFSPTILEEATKGVPHDQLIHSQLASDSPLEGPITDLKCMETL
jgi:hypothetical protein